MMATLSQPATAEYYVMCQLSMRHPNEYYTGGAEPDGVWWNPAGLFGLKTGNTISTKDFYRLYEGYSPETGDKLTRERGQEEPLRRHRPHLQRRQERLRALGYRGARAPRGHRARPQRRGPGRARAHRGALLRHHPSWQKAGKEVVLADIMAGMWQHGESREGDPHLHTHCTILNIARSHKDGKFRALHQYPFYKWSQSSRCGLRQPSRLASANTPRDPHGAPWRGQQEHPHRQHA